MIETILFIFLSAVLCILRALLSLRAIDPATGFYEGYALLIVLQNLLFIAGASAFLIWAALQRKSRWRFPSAFVRGLPLAAAAAALTLCPAVVLMGDLFRFTGGDSSVKLSGSLIQLMGIAAGLAMAGAAFRLCRGKKNGSGILPAALPALYMALIAIQRFLLYPTVASISDQLLEVCALCAGSLFFLSHARVLSGERGRAVSLARGWGFCFPLIAFALCLGEQLAAAARSGLIMDGVQRLLMVLLALYAAVFACTVRTAQK